MRCDRNFSDAIGVNAAPNNFHHLALRIGGERGAGIARNSELNEAVAGLVDFEQFGLRGADGRIETIEPPDCLIEVLRRVFHFNRQAIAVLCRWFALDQRVAVE